MKSKFFKSNTTNIFRCNRSCIYRTPAEFQVLLITTSNYKILDNSYYQRSPTKWYNKSKNKLLSCYFNSAILRCNIVRYLQWVVILHFRFWITYDFQYINRNFKKTLRYIRIYKEYTYKNPCNFTARKVDLGEKKKHGKMHRAQIPIDLRTFSVKLFPKTDNEKVTMCKRL